MKHVVAIVVSMMLSLSASAEPRYGFVLAERIEYRERSDIGLWDLQAGYGGDYHAFRLKTEGEIVDGVRDHAEVQLLYNRAWTAYFDLQFGIRFADFDGHDMSAVVAGIQGMAPYRIEIEAAAFLSDDGDIAIRAEVERNFLLHEKIVLQPRTEIQIASQDIPQAHIGSGINKLSIGLRLRYEVTRKFAPYLGVAWEQRFGDTKDFLQALGQDSSETTLLAGVRFWF